MQKTIYICLVTLFFSFSAFAYGFNEYDPGNGNYGSPYINSGVGINNGTGFWGTNVSREVVTVKAMGTNAYLYMKQPPTKDYYVGTGGQKEGYGWDSAKSVSEYQYKPGDVIQIFYLVKTDKDPVTGIETKSNMLDANGNMQHGYIVSNNGSTLQQSPPDYTVEQANNTMMNTFVSEPTRPYFSYNIYNVNNNSLSENIYKATPTGPVIIRSREIKPYSNIPRVVKENPNFAPGSPFEIAGQILNSTNPQLSLYDAYRIIRDRLDYTAPDDVIPSSNGLGLREKEILEKVLPRVREYLPADFKPDAESVLAMYLKQCDENPGIHPAFIMNVFLNTTAEASIVVGQSDGIPPNNFPEGKNNIFTASGAVSGKHGTDGYFLQLEIDNVLRSPSQLLRTEGTLSAFNKIAAFYAKSKGYTGTVKIVNTVGKKKGNDVAFYGNGVLTVRAIAFTQGKFDNVNDFKSTINHEVLHWKDPKTGDNNYQFKDHANIYLLEASDPDFKNSSDWHKINNANQYMIRIFNSSRVNEVGMNNEGIVAAMKKYSDENTGGVKIYNILFSNAGISSLRFTTSINGQIKDNRYEYQELENTAD